MAGVWGVHAIPQRRILVGLVCLMVLGACGGGGSSGSSGAGTATVTTSLGGTGNTGAGQSGGGASASVMHAVSVTTSGSGVVSSAPAGFASCQGNCTANFTDGVNLVLSATPAGGSTFLGWGGACSGTGNCSLTVTGTEQVTAAFQSQQVGAQYVLQLSQSGSGQVSSSPGGIACSASCSASFAAGTSVILSAQAADGYTFAGWTGACSGNSANCTIVMTGDQTAAALFAPIAPTEYVLAVTQAGSGTISFSNGAQSCTASCSISLDAGTALTLSATPASGFVFSGWSGACSGSTTSCTVTMSAATSVNATFATAAPSQYQLSVTDTGAGTIAFSNGAASCASTCTRQAVAGSSVSLTVTPANGYVFSGWSGACSGMGDTCTLSMTGNLAVGASFVVPAPVQYELAISEAGSGSISFSTGSAACSASCNLTLNAGTSVTLTEQPSAGYSFSGWGGACSGTATTCSVTVNAATNVSATFAPAAQSPQACTASTPVFTSTSAYNFGYQTYGDYNVQIDDWGPIPGTLSMWINSASCWGATATHSVDTSTGASPEVTRGWSPNATVLSQHSTAGYPSAPNWTTLSGLGIQNSALTKVHVKWAMSVPSTPNVGDAVSRWDALIDIYFHTAAQGAPNPPATAWLPQADLQIMQMLMDQPMSGQPANKSGYWAAVMSMNHPWIKTISGVTYVGIIDAFTYNQSGGHTITMMPEPTMFTNASTTGLLWGSTSMVHDVGGIIAWLGQSNPTDDSGNPILNAQGVVVSAPVLDPSWYLTSINAGFEIDFGTSPSNNTWTTTDFWVAIQNEADVD